MGITDTATMVTMNELALRGWLVCARRGSALGTEAFLPVWTPGHPHAAVCKAPEGLSGTTTSPYTFFSHPERGADLALDHSHVRGLWHPSHGIWGREDPGLNRFPQALKHPADKGSRWHCCRGDLAYWCLNPPIPRGNAGAAKTQFPTHLAVYIAISFYANTRGRGELNYNWIYDVARV